MHNESCCMTLWCADMHILHMYCYAYFTHVLLCIFCTCIVMLCIFCTYDVDCLCFLTPKHNLILLLIVNGFSLTVWNGLPIALRLRQWLTLLCFSALFFSSLILRCLADVPA